MYDHEEEIGEMFSRESEMAPIATRWLESAGMVVKPEFVAPWGNCDLVGLRFNNAHVKQRLNLKQFRSVASITRAMLLLQVPDVETQKYTTLDRLMLRMPSLSFETMCFEMERLVADRFVMRTGPVRLQKQNGWMPLQDQLVAIELKLTRIKEAMCQALNNLGFAECSYVGLPSFTAERVANSARWREYLDAGIGLLSVDKRVCKVLIPARRTRERIDEAVQVYCVEKFWRTRPKGN